MKDEQVLAIVDAITDIGRTLTHTVGDYKAPTEGNIGSIMFSLDRIADKKESINDKLSLIESAVVVVAQTIHDNTPIK